MQLGIGSLIIGSPMALWSLLSIPAILAIHFIQQKQQRVRVSTMFLLEGLSPQSTAGKQIDWIRSSAALWFQLLVAILITWLLIHPRWVNSDSVQRVIIILDGSASMSAFTSHVVRDFPPQLERLEQGAAHTEWVLMDSSPENATARVGITIEQVREFLMTWKPHAPRHDLTAVIERARRYRGESGLIIFVTDSTQPPEGVAAELLGDIAIFAVGHPIENVGIIGARFSGSDTDAALEVIVHNFSDSPADRELFVTSGDYQAHPLSMTLQPRSSTIQRVSLPASSEEALVRIGTDQFTLDDFYAVVKEKLKTVNIGVQDAFPHTRFVARLIRSVPGLELSTSIEQADIVFSESLSKPPAQSAIVFFRGSGTAGRTGIIMPEADPLIEGISFDSMMPSVYPDIELESNDRTLVWEGQTPFIIRRSDSSILINIAQLSPQATRVAPLVVFLSRFIEERRQKLPKFERRNLNGLSLHPIVFTPGGADLKLVHHSAARGTSTKRALSTNEALVWRVPSEPGFIDVYQGDELLLRAAVQFADLKESDFKNASTANGIPDKVEEQITNNSRPDPLRDIWIVLALILGVLSFMYAVPRSVAA